MLHQYVQSKINKKNVTRFVDAMPTKIFQQKIILVISPALL